MLRPTRSALAAMLAVAGTAAAAAPAQSDPLPAGSWDGSLTGGQLKLGDGALPAAPIAPGGPAPFAVGPAPAAPSVWRPVTGAVILPPLSSGPVAGTGVEYAASGTLTLSPLDGRVDPASGAVDGTLSVSGSIAVSGRTVRGGVETSTFGSTCQVGDLVGGDRLGPASSATGGQPWSAATGKVRLVDDVSGIWVQCPSLPDEVKQIVFGRTDPGHNLLMVDGTLGPAVSIGTPAGPEPGGVTGVTPPTAGTDTVVTYCKVPEVRGKKVTPAKSLLKKSYCKWSVRRVRSRKPRGTVVSQSLKAGTVKKKWTRVDLKVAK